MKRSDVGEVMRGSRRVVAEYELREHLLEGSTRHDGAQMVHRRVRCDAAAMKDDHGGAMKHEGSSGDHMEG